MNQDRIAFMNFPRPPGRLTTEETAWYLGFSPHDIPVLVSNKLLKPLGSPPQNATRYFAGPDLEKARTDSKWLDRASATLIKHWRKKNEVWVRDERVFDLAVSNYAFVSISNGKSPVHLCSYTLGSCRWPSLARAKKWNPAASTLICRP